MTTVNFMYALSFLFAAVAAVAIVAVVVAFADDRLLQARRRKMHQEEVEKRRRKRRMDVEEGSSEVATAAALASKQRRRKNLSSSWKKRRSRRKVEEADINRKPVPDQPGAATSNPDSTSSISPSSSLTPTDKTTSKYSGSAAAAPISSSSHLSRSSGRPSPHLHLVLPPAPPIYATVDKGAAPGAAAGSAAIYARRVAARHFRSCKGGRMSRISCDVVWAEDEEKEGKKEADGIMVSSFSSASTVSTVKRRPRREVAPGAAVEYATVDREDDVDDVDDNGEEVEYDCSEESVSLRSGDYQYLAEAPFSCQTSIVPMNRNQFYLVVQINVNPQQQQQQQRRRRKQQQQQHGLPVVEEAEKSADNKERGEEVLPTASKSSNPFEEEDS